LHRFTRAAYLVISSKLAMPVKKSVESLHALSDSSYISPVKATGKDAAPQDAPNAEDTDSDADSDEDSGVIPNPSAGDQEKPTRPWNGHADGRLIKAWNIGPTQTQPVEDSRQECFVMSRKFMDASKLFKLPTHSVNATDLHLWKQYRNYGSCQKGSNKRYFRCPMFPAQRYPSCQGCEETTYRPEITGLSCRRFLWLPFALLYRKQVGNDDC
jgi:hypothetical protein